MLIRINPEKPNYSEIAKVVTCLRDGGVIIYPTDTVYGIGCDINKQRAVERVCKLKGVDPTKANFSFICSDLSHLADFTKPISTSTFKLMKKALPGPFTFILPATKLVPKLVLNPKRKTTGIRVPNHLVSQAIVEALGNPIISTSANLQEEDLEEQDFGDLDKNSKHRDVDNLPKMELFDYFEKIVDLIVDDGSDYHYEVSTILDLTDDLHPQILRQGLGKFLDK